MTVITPMSRVGGRDLEHDAGVYKIRLPLTCAGAKSPSRQRFSGIIVQSHTDRAHNGYISRSPIFADAKREY